jgi:prepilin-type N-terminal cleavage/methylation domain-containing protein
MREIFKAKPAFTLAEVLIVVGIIGIVAVLTISNLITACQKKQTEAQLLKFYSTLNQAVRASSEDNGPPSSWVTAKHANTYAENLYAFKNYIAPYMKTFESWNCGGNNNTTVCTILEDGGVMTLNIDINGGDIAYIPDRKYINAALARTDKYMTRHYFAFQFSKVSGVSNNKTNSQNFVEPYTFKWNGTKEDLKTNSSYGCYKNTTKPGFCTKVIQLNGWKIPKDYPW